MSKETKMKHNLLGLLLGMSLYPEVAEAVKEVNTTNWNFVMRDRTFKQKIIKILGYEVTLRWKIKKKN